LLIFLKIAKSQFMKNLLPLFILVLLVSCQKTQKLTPTEKRIVGQWQYDEVNFWPRWSPKDDVTSDFDGFSFQFNDDFTVTMYDQDLNEAYTGIWEVNFVNVSNSDGTTGSDQELIASLSHDVTGEVVQIVWETLGVNNSRIYATHDTKDGCFYYHLKRN